MLGNQSGGNSLIALGTSAALAVEQGHGVLVVAIARHGFRRHRLLDPGEVVGREIDLERAQRFGEPVAPPRRIVSEPASESPMCRTYPALTISEMAPAVSSIGTAGSTRAGR